MNTLPKVDVAVQSYMKPELLLRALLSLKRHSATHVDTVWINDDQSDDWVVAAYQSADFAQALAPWRVRVRRNTRRMGWWYLPVTGLRPRYMLVRRRIRHWWQGVRQARFRAALRHDIRYQWALDSTDKPFLYIIHDDMVFHADVLGTYLQAIVQLDRPSIVGELGQCWRCSWAADGCTPEAIVGGNFPAKEWPVHRGVTGDPWPCRINEWSALISVRAALELEQKHGILFGNYDNKGDVGAFWFAVASQENYEFTDPLAKACQRVANYQHGDGGSGHSVWVDQGAGKRKYDREAVIQCLHHDFGVHWPSEFAPATQIND